MVRPSQLTNLPLTAITYNGRDLYDFGFTASEPPGGRGLPVVRERLVEIPGRDGMLEFEPDYGPRTITLMGTVSGDTLSDLQDNLDGLKALIAIDGRAAQSSVTNRRHGQLHFGDEDDRYYPVRYGGQLTVQKIVPWRRSIVAEVELQFTLASPFAVSQDATQVSVTGLTTARKEFVVEPLGGAPVRPRFLIRPTATISQVILERLAADERNLRAIALTVVGTQTYSRTTGRLGYGLVTGVGQYAQVAATRNFPDDGRVSVWGLYEAQFNATEGGSDRYCWSLRTNATNFIACYFQKAADAFVFETQRAGSATKVQSAAQAFVKNAMLSIGVTRDPSNYRLYIGTEAAAVVSQANFPTLPNTLQLGAFNGTNAWKGTIHEFHVDQAVWSSSDFTALAARKRLSQITRGTRLHATFDGSSTAEASGDHIMTVDHQLLSGDLMIIDMEQFTAERFRAGAKTDAIASIQGRFFELGPGRDSLAVRLASGAGSVFTEFHSRHL